MVLSLAMILFGAELFTNAVEWLGRKLHLGEGAVEAYWLHWVPLSRRRLYPSPRLPLATVRKLQRMLVSVAFSARHFCW